MNSLICLVVFVGAAATAICAIVATVGPNLSRIVDALYGRPQAIRPETSREHWRRVHFTADNARGRELSRQGDAA